MQNIFLVVLLALVLTLTHASPLDFDILVRATSPRYCVTKDVNLLGKVVKYPVYFCKFWHEDVRTRTPFETLSISQVNQACKCIMYAAPTVTVTSVAKLTKTVMIRNREAEPTVDLHVEKRQSTCGMTPDLLRLRFNFTEYTSFCRFYRAW
ncbi:hypothetical protein D6C82_09007 [Aureobasidium pullulans]|nr:hypothetical protein D6C82_09007 [Aureobasidium pullulans]